MKVKHLLGLIVISIIIASVLAFFSLFGDSIFSKVNSQGGKPQLLFTIPGDNPNQSLKEPSFAISDQKGNILVSDSGNHRISIFDKNGTFIGDIGGPKSKKPLVYPYGIGVIDNDKIIVADTGAATLVEYDYQGNYIKTWLDAKGKIKPAGVFVAEDDTVYVTDLAGQQVLVFSDWGILLRRLKPQKVTLDAPQGIAVNEDGTIWVADGGNYNVKLLTPDGEFINAFDGGPKSAFTTVKGLAVDKKGRVYVADTLANEIRVFNQGGNELFSFGPGDDKQGRQHLPVGLSVDDEGNIYVADHGNNEIQVWSWK